MLSFLSEKSHSLQRDDYFLRQGHFPETKDSKDTIQSILFYEQPDPEPNKTWIRLGGETIPKVSVFSSLSLISRERFPELLRTLLLLSDQDAVKLLMDSAPLQMRLQNTTKERAQLLKPFVKYYPAFIAWVKTAEARNEFNDFCKGLPSKKQKALSKQFNKFKSGESWYSKRFKKEEKQNFIRILALKYFTSLDIEVCVNKLSWHNLLDLETILTLSQHIMCIDAHSFCFSQLEQLKDNHLFQNDNIRFLISCPDKAQANCDILFEKENNPIIKTHLNLILKNPKMAVQIVRSFTALQKAGLLDKYRDFLAKHLAHLESLTNCILQLSPQNLFDKYCNFLLAHIRDINFFSMAILNLDAKEGLLNKFLPAIEQQLQEYHLQQVKFRNETDRLATLPDVVVLLDKIGIKEKYIFAAIQNKQAVYNGLKGLASANLLLTHQDFIFNILSIDNDFTDTAKGLIFLAEHHLLNHKIFTIIINSIIQGKKALHFYTLRLATCLSALKLMDLLDEENIQRILSAPEAGADILALENQGFLSTHREQIIKVFKTDSSIIWYLKATLQDLTELKVPIPDNIFTHTHHAFQLARAFRFLHIKQFLKEDTSFTDDIYQLMMDFYHKKPQTVYGVARLLVTCFQCDLNPKIKEAALNFPEQAEDIAHCILCIYGISRAERAQFLLSMITNHIQHVPIILSVLKATTHTNIPLSLSDYLTILQNPKLALNELDKVKRGYGFNPNKPISSNNEISDLHSIRSITQVFSQARRTQGLFKQNQGFFIKSDINILNAIVTLAAGNHTLHPSIRKSVCASEFKREKSSILQKDNQQNGDQQKIICKR